MNKTFRMIESSSHESRDVVKRDGIVLLVVLGMLTLFSVLGVSYLVFTGSQKNAAQNFVRSESAQLKLDPLMEQALQSIVVGSNGPDSITWGNDLLGDLFGQRDAIESYVTPVASLVLPNTETRPATLLGNQLLRFPTQMYFEAAPGAAYSTIYPFRRNDIPVERRYPGYPGAFNDHTVVPTVGFPMDDELNGRYLTFRGGPLEGLTCPIVRYFGDHSGATNGRNQLCGQTVIDIRRHLGSTITIGDQSLTLQDWLESPGFNVASLFYDMDAFGTLAGGELPYSSFLVNGRMLNGPGLGWDRPRSNYATVRGVDRQMPVGASNPLAPFNLDDVVSTLVSATRVERNITDLVNDQPVRNVPYREAGMTGTPPTPPRTLTELGADVPTALQPNYAMYRLAPDRTGRGASSIPNDIYQYLQDLPPGDTDEPYDAPDFNNMWLSYFPGEELLGESAPSFVRPDLLNWIVNNVEDAANPADAARLRQAFVALERSTMRPIPFVSTPTVPSDVEARGQGVKRLSYSNFTGGNNSDGLGEPIDFFSTDVNYLSTKLLAVARALAGQDNDGDGIIDSWDVDNNGDGRVDSVWVDAGLPLTQTADGRLVKPMVSYMVEDLGGRINVNLAGNIVQARNLIQGSVEGAVQMSGASPVVTATPAAAPHLVYLNTTSVTPWPRGEAVQTGLPTGWGYGPAELDLRQLFLPFGTAPYLIQPSGFPTLSTYTASNPIRGPQRIVAERTGLFSTRFGRQSPLSNLGDNLYFPIGTERIFASAGHIFDPMSNVGLTTPSIRDDFRGMMRQPNRPNLHRLQHPQGLPVDAWGRGSIGLGVSGDLALSGTSHVAVSGGSVTGTSPDFAGAGDSLDDPYEFAMNGVNEPNKPFTYADLEPLLNNAGLDRDLLSQRLVTIISEYHNSGAMTPQALEQLQQALADSITTHSNSVAAVRGGLPAEFHDDPAVVGVVHPATLAGSPQEHIKQTMRNWNTSATNQEMNAVLWELMPEELRAGRKFNLNRPFGNGFDDDSDGVIDDDMNGVFDGGTTADANSSNHLMGPGNTTIAFSTNRGKSVTGELYNNQPVTGTAPIRINVSPRAQFARHLYVLVMMLIRDATNNQAFDFPHNYQAAAGFNSPFYDPGSFGNNDNNDPNHQLEEFNAEYRAWKIAQWAANVADFRDADGVMTRFDYDPNPFDGWGVNLQDNRTYRTVWGLERPELTLEESIAFHDRNVRDTNVDTTGQKSLEGTDGSATRGDDDMDQYRKPQGTTIFEVRSVRSPQELRVPGSEVDRVANAPSYPQELYVETDLGPALDLGAMAPGRAGSSPVPAVPVWRIAISESHSVEALTGNGDRGPAVIDVGGGPQTVPYLEGSPDFLTQPVGSLATQTVSTLPPNTIEMDRDTLTLNPKLPQFFFKTGHIPQTQTLTPAEIAQRANAIDRVVFFTPNLTSAHVATIAGALDDVTEPGQIFYNRFTASQYETNTNPAATSNQLLVPTGQHVVVGPRPITYIGSRRGGAVVDPDSGAPLVTHNMFVSPQRIELGPHQLSYVSSDAFDHTPTIGRLPRRHVGDTTNPEPVPNASIRPVIGVQAAADAPEAWADQNQTIGLNVSEPIPYRLTTRPAGRQYYPEPTDSLGNGFPVDGYRDYANGTGNLPDRPFDSTPGMSELHRVFGDAGVQTGTRLFFKTAYLQRLADPTQPYHAEFNPYISVDYITIDLTVFNGADDNNVSRTDTLGTALWVDDQDQNPFVNAPAELFGTRYKTGNPVHVDATGARFDNLAHSINTFPPQASTASPVELNFPFDFAIDGGVRTDPDNLAGAMSRANYSPTLGYANHSYGTRWRQGPNAPTGTGGYNEAVRSVSAFVGMPFSNYMRDLMWLNRPYVSPHELMWVPTSGPGRIGLEFSVSLEGGQVTSNQYDAPTNTITAPAPPPTGPGTVPAGMPSDTNLYSFNERFKHLWNYFSSSSVFQYSPGTDITEPYPDVPDRQPAPNFYRILEWVGVPAPYDFETDFIDPLSDTPGNNNFSLDHSFGLNFDFRTLGPINYSVGAIPNPQANVNADPRSWTNVFVNTTHGYLPTIGGFGDPSPATGEWNGFWTNLMTIENLRPPFNIRDGLFRNGLVNLNTIKNIRGYKALVAGYSNATELNQAVGNKYPIGKGAFFDDFVASRRGYTPSSDLSGNTANNWFERGTNPLQTYDHDDNLGTPEIPAFDRNIPTQFAGVFKSAMGANIAPLESMRERSADANNNPWDHRERDSGTKYPREANSETRLSIVRSEFDRSGTTGKPVFSRDPAGLALAQNHESSVINQQLGMTRLSNLATDQSNVFAVWITVGLFEVDSATMTVGKEYGLDLGTAQRKRGFFIIDRSKPVMYEPGEWNNARQTVVYERVR